jgi:hypothetical protein
MRLPPLPPWLPRPPLPQLPPLLSTLPGAEQRLRTLRAWALAGGVLLLRPYWPLNFLPGWVVGALLLWASVELLLWIWRPRRWR